jgi:hypothetical protein
MAVFKKQGSLIGPEVQNDLRIWERFPKDNPTCLFVLLRHFLFGLFGATTGPTNTPAQYAAVMSAIFELMDLVVIRDTPAILLHQTQHRQALFCDSPLCIGH